MTTRQRRFITEARADLELALANIETSHDLRRVGDTLAASAAFDHATREVERALISLNWATGRGCRDGFPAIDRRES